MKKIAILLLPLILLACNSQRTFDRVVKKHPEYLSKYLTTVVDTVRFSHTETDTFIVPGDTVLFPVDVIKRDTVFKQGRITITSRNGWVSAHTKTDTFLQRDTIKIETTVPVRVYTEKNKANLYLIGGIIALFLLLILALKHRFTVKQV
jgi:hypothetical protein